MDIYVLNKQFETIAIIDNYESLIWTDRYAEAGDFEVYMPMQVELLEFFKQDNYLRINESEHLMIIDTIEITSDYEDGNRLRVTGRSLENILSRRIIWGEKIYENGFQNAIKSMITEAFMTSSNAERYMPNFIFQESIDPKITGLTLTAKYRFDDLYEVVKQLCSEKKVGFKIILDDNNNFVFSLYVGADRSYDQTNLPYVIFSPKFENIINGDYTESSLMYKTVAYVEGAEERSRIVYSDKDAKGLYRREVYVSASDISLKNAAGQTIPTASYNSLLDQRGNEALDEDDVLVTFDGQTETTQLFVYGEDFFIGDIVQLENEYGSESKVVVKELVFNQDNSGIYIYPTFETVKEDKKDQ